MHITGVEVSYAPKKELLELSYHCAQLESFDIEPGQTTLSYVKLCYIVKLAEHGKG